MKASEFDSRLRAILDAEEVPADPEQWNRLAAALPGAKVRISRRLVNWMRAVGWAAAVLLLAGGGYAYWHNGQPDAPGNAPLAAASSSGPAGTAAMPPAAPPALSSTPVPLPAPVASNRRAHFNPAPLNRPAQNPLPAEPAEVGGPLVALTPSAAQPAAAEPRPAPAPAAGRPQESAALLPAGLLQEPPVRRAGGATALGLAGAYRYSGQNAGYALGLSLRQRLGKKVFLDGDVAYLGSSSSTSTSRMDAATYSRLANPQASSAGMSRQPLPATAATSLSYLQVAPALSYQVLPALSIGAGPDVQRILAQGAGNQLVRYDQASAPEYIPAIDWGLSGKAEYSIGHRLRAGVQYRRGFNNALRNESGITYVERSYMQVQLRVFLLK